MTAVYGEESGINGVFQASRSRPNNDGSYSVSLEAPDGLAAELTIPEGGLFDFVSVRTQRRAVWNHNFVLLATTDMEGVPGACFTPWSRMVRWGGSSCSRPTHLLGPEEQAAVLPSPLVALQGVIQPVVVLATPSAGAHVTQVPRANWRALPFERDPQGGLVVPLWTVVRRTGVWSRSSTARLLTPQGTSVPVNNWDAIHSTTYPGELWLELRPPEGPDGRFLVAGPRLPAACACFTLMHNGQAAAAYLATLEGALLGGPPLKLPTNAQGELCATHAPSEADGEDLDGNGVAGETRTISVHGVSRDGVHASGTFTAEQTTAAGCTQRGALDLQTVANPTVQQVTVHGVTLDGAGNPVASALVMARDLTVTPAEHTATCQGICVVQVHSGGDGVFDLVVPSRGRVAVRAQWTLEQPDGTSVHHQADAWVTNPQQVTLLMEPMTAEVPVTVRVDQDVVTWDPPLRASRLSLRRQDGLELWRVAGSASGISPPVTLGQAPEGAVVQVESSNMALWNLLDVDLLEVDGTGLVRHATAQVLR